MAALPAYAGVCAGLVAAWSEEYANRSWCQVELLMSYAFANSGRFVYVLPQGFTTGKKPTRHVFVDKMTLADPAQGAITVESDRAVVESLTRTAKRSTSYSCWRTCTKSCSIQDPITCFILNVGCCCQFCGYGALMTSRSVAPGKSVVKKVVPGQMQRL